MSATPNKISDKKLLRKQYFCNLKQLQKKYDLLLQKLETKPIKPVDKATRQKNDDLLYNQFIKQVNDLKKLFTTDINQLTSTLSKAKNKSDYQILTCTRIKIKAVKRQYKKSIKNLKLTYHLKTLDPIRSDYIRERNAIIEEYHHQLKTLKLKNK
jgi:hypothetical protein